MSDEFLDAFREAVLRIVDAIERERKYPVRTSELRKKVKDLTLENERLNEQVVRLRLLR